MLILGLDPGSRHTGFGLVEQTGDRLQARAHGRLSFSSSLTLPRRLSGLHRELGDLLDRWRPAAVVLETPFHGVNSRSLIVLAQARGALLVALAAREVEIWEYTPSQVKTAVTGNGRADKRQVARMVRLLLALEDGGASADATDALALAICGAHRHRLDHLARGPRPTPATRRKPLV